MLSRKWNKSKLKNTNSIPHNKKSLETQNNNIALTSTPDTVPIKELHCIKISQIHKAVHSVVQCSNTHFKSERFSQQ